MTALNSIRYRQEPSPADAEAVRRIVLSSGFFSSEEIDIAEELVRERLEKGPASGYHFLIAEQAGRTVGYACFGPIPGTVDSFDLYWIAVHGDLRGSGIGKEILGRAEEIIARMGGSRVFADTSARDQYEPTRAFYRACGYGQEALIRDFYSPGDHKTIFVKTLGPQTTGRS